MDPRTFLTIENAITERLWSAWRPMAAELYAKVRKACDEGNFGQAYDLAKSLDLTPIAEQNKEWIKFHLLSAAIFGAHHANPKGRVNAVSLGQHENVLNTVANTFITGVEFNATTQVYNDLVQLIAGAEEADKVAVKADDDTPRFLEGYVDFRDSGDAALQLQSSLHTARLAVWGFTAEADLLGISTYRLQAVLDGRTSQFCQYINGKTFKVAQARSRITDALSATDPNDLKTIQPWPKQTKAGMSDIKELSNEELAARGYAVPPFHPNCRTLCVLVGTEQASAQEATAPEIQRADLGDLPESISTMDTFNELDAGFSPDDVDYWNANMGLSPISTLATIADVPATDVLTDFAGTDAITITDDGDISFKVQGDLIGDDSKVKMNVVFDPVQNQMVVNYIEMAGTGVEAAADFVDRTYQNLLNVAASAGATKLVMRASGADDLLAHAAMGFVPETAADWYQLKTSILADMGEKGSLAYLQTELSPTQMQALTDVLHSADTNAFLVLTELPYSVNGTSLANLLLDGRSMDMAIDVSDQYQGDQFFG